jgi:hypothetical protein
MEILLMRMNIALLSVSLAILSTSTFAYHELVVANNTTAFASAKAGTSPCSNIIGDGGILKPHTKLTIPQMVIDMYCKKNCDVDVYISKSCSGKSVATAHVDYRDGVTTVTNHGVGSYYAAGTGYNMSLEGSAKLSWYDFIFSAF